MARTVARSTLRTRIRYRTNTESETDPSDTELNDAINEALTEVYDLLVLASPPDYYSTETSITVTTSVTYALPSDFYKVRRVWEDKGSNRRTQLDLVPDDRRQNYVGPSGGQTVIMRYIPASTTLTSDASTFDGVDGWDELVVLVASIDVLNKKDIDPSPLMAKRDRIERRIREMAPRDFGNAPTIATHANLDPYAYWNQNIAGYNIVGGNLELYRFNPYWT